MRRYLILIILSLLILFGCAQPGAGLAPPAEGTKQIIEVKVVDQLVHYQCQSFWVEEKFAGILADKTGFEVKTVEEFNKNVARYGERGEYVVLRSIKFNEDKRATILTAEIHNAISKSGDSYHATFLWLLQPLGLDFIDDNFNESKHGLSWEGRIDSISTTIKVECPSQDSVYEAWQQPVGHCHGHIWWPVS